MSDLFRKEAITHRRERLYGDVIMTIPATHWSVTTLILLVLGAVVACMVFVSYGRKESIAGWLRPDRGVLRIQTSDEGIVERMFVHEGDTVRAGDPLVALKLDPQVVKGESYGRALTEDLLRERHQLEQQVEAASREYDVREARVRGEIESLERELAQYRAQLAILERRIVLSQQQLDQRKELVSRGFLSALEAAKFEDALLASRQAKAELQQDILAKEHILGATRFDLASVPHAREAAVASLREKLATLDQKLTETRRRTAIVLGAPMDATVTDIRFEVGETARAGAVLAELIPSNARLQAEFFVPTRAAGFLQEGSEVQLRYDAFPYQKYGVGHGTVVRISKSSMDAKDLPKGVAAEEPVFRVFVALSQDYMELANRRYALRSGMTVKADLILERQRLGEILFSPFFGALRRG